MYTYYLQIIYSWFDKMKMFLEEVKIADASDLASRLWNADETGFSLAIASGQILAKRGSRDVHETGGGTGREYVTVLGCGSADGSRISPYILYKGVHLYKRWTVGGLGGTLYSVSKSGWMEADNFIQWFLKLFVPLVNHLLSTGPIVLSEMGTNPSIPAADQDYQGERDTFVLPSSPYHPHLATS